MFLIELPKPKSLEVLSSFENSYHKLCDSLDIKKGRLVILNPNRKTKMHRGKVKLKALTRDNSKAKLRKHPSRQHISSQDLIKLDD